MNRRLYFSRSAEKRTEKYTSKKEMNTEHYHPLFDDIADGDVAAVESFLQTPDVDVDYLFEGDDEPLYPPLNWAIRCNHQTIVELLLAHGAAVNGPVGAYRTPLQQACERWTANEDIVKLLIDHGADVDKASAKVRDTPLYYACNSNTKLGIVQLLINAGADVNGGGGVTAPLHWAAYGGNIKAIELLIEAGADVNRASTENNGPAGRTPLHWVARENDLDCLNTLLAAGADPNIADSAGETPLHRAALGSSVDVINALLEAGCDPLHQDNDGRTPLQYQYEVKHNELPFSADEFEVITALVAAGDRSWECVPTPCPGLEAAMVSVWQAAPDELPELVKRMENPPQTLIELYARMDDDDEEMKKVVQEVLRLLHHHFAGFPHLKQHLLNSIFGFKTSV